ncbi:alpha/beta fold hydrolase [Urbifossiella limnaea]|uniref:2-hydroxymuconate semialdehyde hydrolase n=1 Tax=Urbifossiella limnaea TaxID=2528023 RepID=A0A517XYS1_9BACT|nr:alpha/beta hydrolase [Urbifossiella limnaea]QDU22608.1 2-hydroxymuconate semialdehyde hydrolase [Urbifossiella limnaea]
MSSPFNGFLARLRPRHYGRRPPLVLLNGLAEQAESWYRNREFWSRYFEVLAPNILAYEGDTLHHRIRTREPITVEYLVCELHTYLTRFVETPPYHLVASSLGGKVAVEFAVRYPDLVDRIVLLCPSGMGDEEKLPIMEGLGGRGADAMVKSVFYNPRKCADYDVLEYYQAKFDSRRWKLGFVKAVRGTLEHTVRDKLKDVAAPTLLVTGEEDKVCDPAVARDAAKELPSGLFLALPKCGHAPQIEKAWKVNRLVAHFLTSADPTTTPSWSTLFLTKPPRPRAK